MANKTVLRICLQTKQSLYNRSPLANSQKYEINKNVVAEIIPFIRAFRVVYMHVENQIIETKKRVADKFYTHLKTDISLQLLLQKHKSY